VANRAVCFCLLALIFEGSTSAFFTTSTKPHFKQPLKNAYLETLTISDTHDKRTVSTAATRSTNLGTMHTVIQANIPTVDIGVDETKSSPDGKTMLPKDTIKEQQRQQTTDAEVFPVEGSPTLPKVTQNHSGWTQVGLESEKLQNAKELRKASYESERKKYDQASFAHNSRDTSSREQDFQQDEETEDVAVQASVVEVLPKDPPLFPDDGRHDYLACKNMELAKENSDLQRENERQKFELESFLRDSLSDPLDHHIADNRALWHDDSLIEANSRLRSENELQRHDLQAIQSEMNGMENIIQSIEDRSYLETQKLENLNDQLRNDNERQKQQIETFTMQMNSLQDLVQAIRDEAVSLENEKKKLQNDNDLLTTKLRGLEGESERKTFELGNRNEQISGLQNVIETLQSDYSKLQNQHDLEIKDKVSLESKFDGAVGEFEKQRYELEAYKKDRASMESLVHSIREESEALQSDKKELQDTIMNMKLTIEDMSQQLLASQNKMGILNAEKEEMAKTSQAAHGRLQSQLEDSLSQLKQISDEKNGIEMRLQSLENENERQRYDIDNSSRDKRALEVMIQSMQNEAEALKNDKTTVETTLVGVQQEKQKLEHQLSISKEAIERLQSEKDAASSQSNENYAQYHQLQLRFQEVVDELESCQRDAARMHANLDYEGVDEDFMSRINSRQQNQMRRNQIDEPRNRSWWN